jgi:hypothetical protein
VDITINDGELIIKAELCSGGALADAKDWSGTA